MINYLLFKNQVELPYPGNGNVFQVRTTIGEEIFIGRDLQRPQAIEKCCKKAIRFIKQYWDPNRSRFLAPHERKVRPVEQVKGKVKELPKGEKKGKKKGRGKDKKVTKEEQILEQQEEDENANRWVIQDNLWNVLGRKSMVIDLDLILISTNMWIRYKYINSM